MDFSKRAPWEIGYGIGLFILLLKLSSIYFPAGEKIDWIGYGILGFTMSIFLGESLIRYLNALRSCSGLKDGVYNFIKLKKFITIAGAVVAIEHLLRSLYESPALLIGCIISLIIAIFLSKGSRLNKNIAINITLVFLIGLVLFYPFISLPLINLPKTYFKEPISQLFIFLIIFACGAISFSITKAGKWDNPGHIDKIWNGFLHSIALSCFAFLCFSTNQLDTTSAIHHWRAIIEPAAAVRNGGWLLWDTPSQYGFLMTLLIAALPTENVWQSLYLINGTLLTVLGFSIFAFLYKQNRSLGGFFMAFLVSIFSLILLPALTMGDHRMTPSAGVIRFLWVYIFIGYSLLLWYVGSATKNNFPAVFQIVFGSLLWVFGAFWSSESAVYCAVMWLPTSLLIVYDNWLKKDSNVRKLILALTGLLLWYAILFSVVVLFITLYYKYYLSHYPDWSLFSAYVSSYKNLESDITLNGENFSFALPIDLKGSVLFLLTMFFSSCLFMRMYLDFAKKESNSISKVCVFYSCISGMFISVSYFIARSHEQNIINLTPLFVFCVSSILLVFGSSKLPEGIIKLYKQTIACCFAAILIATAPMIFYAPSYGIDSLSKVHEIKDEGLRIALKDAGVTSKSHVLLLDDMFEGIYAKTWLLPSSLTAFYAPLPKEKYQTLAERRAKRLCEDGYVVESMNSNLERVPWIKSVIDNYYKNTYSINYEKWRILKYERIDHKC